VSLESRRRLNLALVVIVAALAALALFRPGHKQAADVTPLVADSRGFTSIRVAVAGRPEVDLKREGEVWSLTAPLQWRADEVQVQDFLDSLDAPVADHFPAKGVDLSKYGLDKPLVKMWLDGTEYDLGDQQPVDKERYVLVGGEIKIIDDYIFYRVARDAYGWVDKQLLPDGAHITALQLPHATLTSDAKGAWSIAPADKTLTPADFSHFVQTWQQARATGVVAIGGGKPEGEVSIQLAGAAAPLRFQILDDPDYLVLARPDLHLEYQMELSRSSALLAPSHAVTSSSSSPHAGTP
jgi:uncharacterized protein DUF4340